MRKRAKRLSGLPSEHETKGKSAVRNAEYYTRQAEAGLEKGNCREALSGILFSTGAINVWLTHIGESEGKLSLHNGPVDRLEPVVDRFKRECLRKPGLLDRFKRKGR